MPSIKHGVDGHYGGYMIDPQYERVPRDWGEHMLALEEAEKAPSLTKAREILAPFSMHSIHSALAEMPMFHLYAQVRTDSMHLFDCGGTMWHLIFLGNWIFSEHGADMLALANERLTAMPWRVPLALERWFRMILGEFVCERRRARSASFHAPIKTRKARAPPYLTP